MHDRCRPSSACASSVDSTVFTGEGLRHPAAECGADHVFMGTDESLPWTTTSVDHILDAPGFTDPEGEGMLWSACGSCGSGVSRNRARRSPRPAPRAQTVRTPFTGGASVPVPVRNVRSTSDEAST